MSSHADARPDRPVAAPVLEFRLDEQVERLRREPAWRSGTRDAITLAKGPVLRVVLTVLRAGAHLDEHRAPGPLTLQLLSGSLRFQAAGETRALAPGMLVVLDAALPHRVEAVEDSAFLLTLVQAA